MSRKTSPPSSHAGWTDLLWLVPVAAVVRIVYLIQFSSTPLARHLLVDEKGYHLWARAVASGQLVGPGPFYQAPLYPYLLGAWYALFGESLLAVRLVQSVMGILSCVLLYRIGAWFFGRRTGRIAGLAAALYAPFLFYEGQILKAAAALLATCMVVLLLGRASESERLLPWLHAGLGLGLLALLRGNALLYLPFLAGWILWPRGDLREPGRWRHALQRVGLLGAGTLLAVSPATLHNLAAGGGPILTTYQGGTNFYIGNHDGAPGVYSPLRLGRETPRFEGLDAREEASRRVGRPLAAAEVSRFWFREGLRFAAESPLQFLRLQAFKLVLVWNAREIPDVWDVQFVRGMIPILRAPLLRFGWIAPLGLLGMLLALPYTRRSGLLVLLVVATMLSISIFYVFARYRLPLAPLTLVFAAYAIERGIGMVQERAWRSLTVALVVLLPLIALVHLDLARYGLVFTNEVGHQNLGFLHLEDGHTERAEEQFALAVEINPDMGTAWQMLARLQSQRGDRTAHSGTLEALLAHVELRRTQGTEVLDPIQEASARRTLGALHREEGRVEEAVTQFRTAAALQLEDPVAPIQLGITLRMAGSLDQAADAYREALRRDPENPLALTNLANVEIDRGDQDGAIRLLRQAALSCVTRRPELCANIESRLQGLDPQRAPRP